MSTSGWKERDLGDFITLKRGYDLPQRLRENGSIPIYSSSGISGFHSQSKVNPPGVVTGRYGSIGQVFFCEEAYWPLNTTLYVQNFKGNDPLFTYYFLQKFNWHKFNDKSAVPGVNRNDLHAELVQTPPLEEQKAIAAVLSCLDAKIENLRKQNETLERIAQTLFKQWFIDFEFPNEDGKPYKSSGGAMIPSELGEIPEDWRVGTFGEAFTLNYGKSLTADKRITGNYPVVGSSGIVDYHNDFLVKSPSIVIGRKGTIGKVIWLDYHFYPIDTTFYVTDNLGVNRLYFYYFLLRRQNFSRLTSDSAVPGLNRDMAYSVEFVLPYLQLINSFNKKIAVFFQKEKINLEEIQTLIKTRDTLLPKLMSGQLRVR